MQRQRAYTGRWVDVMGGAWNVLSDSFLFSVKEETDSMVGGRGVGELIEVRK